MIYYRKTLFGRGPKLTAVQKQVNYLEAENAELTAIKVTFVRPDDAESSDLSILNKSS